MNIGGWNSPLGIKIFLAAGIPFGASQTALFLSMFESSSAAINAGVASGLAFGGFMAVVLGGAQVFSTTKGGRTSASLGVESKRTFAVLADRDQVFQQLHQAFRELGVKKFNFDDIDAGVLTGHTSIGIKSWGENLTALVKQKGEVCEVTVTSAPRVPTTLVDYGKNDQNISAIENQLIASMPVEQLVVGTTIPKEVSSLAVEAHAVETKQQDLNRSS